MGSSGLEGAVNISGGPPENIGGAKSCIGDACIPESIKFAPLHIYDVHFKWKSTLDFGSLSIGIDDGLLTADFDRVAETELKL